MTTASITSLKLRQEYGIYTGLDATYRVSGLTSSSIAAGAVDALAAVPAYLSEFSGNSNLVLVTKEAELNSFSNTNDKVFNVNVSYIAKSELQDLWIWRWESQLQQKAVNHDVLGLPLYVEYTYPEVDPADPAADNKFRPELAGQTVRVGASVTADYAVAELVGVGLVDTDTPGNYVDQWMNRVNSEAWGMFAAGVVRVSRVVPKVVDYSTTPHKCLIEVVLQVNTGGFDRTYAFTDPNTGEMPQDVVPGTGYKQAILHNTLDFNKIWPMP